MNTYGVIGGTLWGNRGAEAMVVTTIGRTRERDPDASFVLLSYFPDRDRALLQDPAVTVADARPLPTIATWLAALVTGAVSLVGIRLPDAVLPAPVRALRRCRALFDVSGISFHDGRLAVVAYNLLCVWPAVLLRIPVIRLSQAMGPFRHPVNRQSARWVTRRSFHTFARGRLTADYLAKLQVPPDTWSVAPDVAFAYRPEYSLTVENDDRVAKLVERLEQVRTGGADVVALVPSSLVNRKMANDGRDYVTLLWRLVRDLHQRGTHVLVMPNATRAGVAATRNNDITVVTQLRERITAQPDGIDPDAVSYVDFDVNTAGIRSLTERCTLLITSRFHAMVAALALGVPPVVMGWSHKYEEVLEMFGCETHSIDFSRAERELFPMVERLLTDHETARKRILTSLPEVETAAIAQFELVDRLP